MSIIMQLLAGAYASTGVIATIGYIPTIKDLFHWKMSANISSYVMWTFCAGITFAYSVAMFSDLLLNIVTGLNFGCCALILGLALFVKNNKVKK